jgi:hypothetical protein
MEAELVPIVRYALRQAQRHPERASGRTHRDNPDLNERILATARWLTETDPMLALSGREGLVRPIARQLAESLARCSPPEPRPHLGSLETVRM